MLLSEGWWRISLPLQTQRGDYYPHRRYSELTYGNPSTPDTVLEIQQSGLGKCPPQGESLRKGYQVWLKLFQTLLGAACKKWALHFKEAIGTMSPRH
jgi:hypothetical protein